MRILLSGANGYIGKRLLPILLEDGHDVICCVRDKNRFSFKDPNHPQLQILEIDFLNLPDLATLPKDIDAAYFLIHSMSTVIDDFESLEVKSAQNFRDYMNATTVKQVIYLGGISNDKKLSAHLKSRQKVGQILKQGKYHTTILRAGIIVGSGSASFEIIRDLVEKLPVMTAPKWLLTKTQPIAIRDVIGYLNAVLQNEQCLDKTFDIGGPEVLTYKEMLLQYSKVRGLKRLIITFPVMSPRLSSYWLYFVTSTSYKLAVNLVNSMKSEVICANDDILKIIPIKPISYSEAVKFAYDRIEQNIIISSWKDSLVSGVIKNPLSKYIEVPQHGCYKDEKSARLDKDSNEVLNRIWTIGGQKGWYYVNRLWQMRGFLDKLVGGVGLRRGRTHPEHLYAGDALDFWRVLLADKEQKRLLLFAEMKLPGEAWLEFRIENQAGREVLYQIATFRPRGIMGRLYWHLVKPFHYFVFNGMIKNIARG